MTQRNDRMAWLSPSDPEWDRAWHALADAVGDYSDECPETGERWQYMGTVQTSLPAIGSNPLIACVHQFRHRHRSWKARPAIKGFCGDSRGCRVYVDIGASVDYAPFNGVAALQPTRVRTKTYAAELEAAHAAAQANCD